MSQVVGQPSLMCMMAVMVQLSGYVGVATPSLPARVIRSLDPTFAWNHLCVTSVDGNLIDL